MEHWSSHRYCDVPWADFVVVVVVAGVEGDDDVAVAAAASLRRPSKAAFWCGAQFE